tara:strand:+ start:418 stop:648 length:231 start_codon:yes stop_codon:yes gene_type:complete
MWNWSPLSSSEFLLFFLGGGLMLPLPLPLPPLEVKFAKENWLLGIGDIDVFISPELLCVCGFIEGGELPLDSPPTH